MKRLLFLFLIVVLAVSAQTMPGVGDFSIAGNTPVAIPKATLPSWLNSDYAPIFNGVNQFASASAAAMPIGSSARTIMYWSKPFSAPAVANNYRFTVMYGGSGGVGSGMLPCSDGNNAYMFWSSSSYCRQPAIHPVSEWHHYAFVLPENGTVGSLSIFFDGSLLTGTKTYATATATSTVNTLPDTLFFGKYITTSFPYNGETAELAIFNKALTAAEIQKYMPKRLKGTESGLVALFHCNDNSQTLVDSVGGRNAIASNSVAWTRRNGYAAPDVRAERYALSFDGATQYASSTWATPLVATYPFTLSGWAHIASLSNNQYSIAVALGSSTLTTSYINISLINGGGNLIVDGQISAASLNETSAIIASSGANLGKWYFLTFVGENRTSRKVYVNAVQVATNVSAIDLHTDWRNVALEWTPGGLLKGKGKTAESSIWNVALTPTQIQSLMYTQLTGAESGLVFYVRGSEGTGTTLDDLSPTNKDMTLYGTPTWVGRDIP